MTWMTSIVRNRCLDWLRRPNPEYVLDKEDGGDPLDDFASGDEGPMEKLARADDSALLHRCLERLEARQRQAIALAFMQGLSHSELAQQLRQPLGTVKTWVRRGLAQLKSCLSPT